MQLGASGLGSGWDGEKNDAEAWRPKCIRLIEEEDGGYESGQMWSSHKPRCKQMINKSLSFFQEKRKKMLNMHKIDHKMY